MAEGRLFVVVSLPGLASEGAKRTAAYPNSVIDMLIEPADGAGSWRQLSLSRGIPLPEVQDMVLDLTRRYGGPVDVLCQEGPGDVVAYRVDMTPAAQRDAVMRLLSRLQREFGATWTHVEHGELTLRIPCRTRTGGEVKARKVEGFLAASGVHGEASVRRIKGRELGSWHEVEDLLREVGGIRLEALAPLPRALA